MYNTSHMRLSICVWGRMVGMCGGDAHSCMIQFEVEVADNDRTLVLEKQFVYPSMFLDLGEGMVQMHMADAMLKDAWRLVHCNASTIESVHG